MHAYISQPSCSALLALEFCLIWELSASCVYLWAIYFILFFSFWNEVPRSRLFAFPGMLWLRNYTTDWNFQTHVDSRLCDDDVCHSEDADILSRSSAEVVHMCLWQPVLFLSARIPGYWNTGSGILRDSTSVPGGSAPGCMGCYLLTAGVSRRHCHPARAQCSTACLILI